MSISLLHSFRYMERLMASGIKEIDSTTSLINSAFFIGSFLLSLKSKSVLKTIKSLEFSSKNLANSSVDSLLE